MILYIERLGSGWGGIQGAYVVNTGRRISWEVELKKREENQIFEVVRSAEKHNLKEKRIVGDFSLLDFFLESTPKKKLPVTMDHQVDRMFCVDINKQSVKCVKDTNNDFFEPDNAMINQKLEELLLQL